MAPLLVYLLIIIIFFFFVFVNAEGPPSPGYYPSSRVASTPFNQAFTNLWGSQDQTIDHDTLTIWLDKTTGSEFKSLRSYSSGYFGAAIKLQPGYTARVITSFYEEMSRMYVMQTNVYIRGSGDTAGNNIIGREMKFHLWFDPTQDFHNYAILWNPTQIVYLRKSDETFPLRGMWVHGSIWDASSWATDNDMYKLSRLHIPALCRTLPTFQDR